MNTTTRINHAYNDLNSVRIKLDEVEAKMRKGVAAAEKRLGITKVIKAMKLLTAAQENLRELTVLINPMPEGKWMTTDEMIAKGLL